MRLNCRVACTARLVNFLALLLLSLAYSNLSYAAATSNLSASQSPSFGTHGMVLFGGRDGLFLSHLPMFHAPHDHQVLLEIELSDAALDQTLRATLEARPGLWTINPEPFALTDLWKKEQPLKAFSAELFEGHFERGGTVRFKAVQIRIRRVVLHAKLKPLPRTKSSVGYQIVRHGSSAFLVKRLNMRPDFDHIVRLNGLSDRMPDGLRVKVIISSIAQPSNAALAAAMAQVNVPAQLAQTIYFDTADLR